MTFTTQLILLVLTIVMVWLLLRAYRKQDAMGESFLCSIVLMVAGCVVPDAVLFFPVVWWAFHLLWCDNLRVYLASVLGILFVVFYAVLVYVIWPESWLVSTVQSTWADVLTRKPVYWPDRGFLPLWYVGTVAVTFLMAVWAVSLHTNVYSRANVRVQTRMLLTLPFLGVSFLSSICPTFKMNGLFIVFVALTAYLWWLYVSHFGMPKAQVRPQNPSRSKKIKQRKLKRRKRYYY